MTRYQRAVRRIVLRGVVVRAKRRLQVARLRAAFARLTSVAPMVRR